MRMKLRLGALAAVGAFAVGLSSAADAGVINRAIDDSKLITLDRNLRPEANALNDRGRMDDSVKFGGWSSFCAVRRSRKRRSRG